MQAAAEGGDAEDNQPRKDGYTAAADARAPPPPSHLNVFQTPPLLSLRPYALPFPPKLPQSVSKTTGYPSNIGVPGLRAHFHAHGQILLAGSQVVWSWAAWKTPLVCGA